MAVGSGIGSSVGLAAESAYGTYAAPTRFIEARSFNVKKVQNTAPQSGVAAGRPAAVDEVVTTTAATGQIQADVLRKGFGLLLAQLMGSSATPVQQGATAAYLQTHVLGDNFGKSLTMQAGLPNVGGTVIPITATGCKITQAEFSCAVDGILGATFDFDGKTWTDAQALTAPSYTAANAPFHFGEMSVKLGTYGSEAAVQGVRSVSLTIARPQDTGRFYAGNAGAKAEPVWNDFAAVSGTLEVDLVNKADFLDRFTGHTSTSLVLEWVGATAIATSYYPTLRFSVPKVYFNGDVPEVGGPDVLKASIPFTAFYDTTNGLVSAAYISTDTAL
ncbi:phage tail tube protein [Nocardioides KLBMP 9356]|uniref:Phage tail tube protein n=1 Tax=Nocardioides potassii TaxID=2911371 RepID=A0ABS9H8V8_9ACTN|nr:phage tail tube protein [Nocardioides potassii]MCF6376899.1 phage tail tube protein [Nocardioides potassii]